MRLTIVVPYLDADTQVPFWANEEAGIDFRRQPDLAARCTLAFAATELKHYLARTIDAIDIVFANFAPDDADTVLTLAVVDPASRSEAFVFEPDPQGLVIRGDGRTGTLYGAYELLRLQGWQWLAPGETGECPPPPRQALHLPAVGERHAPVMHQGRGFDFEGPLKESPDLWLWMARNRLNVAIPRAGTGPLLKKLGMTFKAGGHIFERMLAPDRVLPDGRTLWDAHPDWYGLPPDGKRDQARALRTQFCVSKAELVRFLAEEFLAQLMGEWREADRVDVWGFDTWGNTCACADCAALGNSSDQTLHFLSGIRHHLDEARRQGRLDHDVQLIVCAYEGTATLVGPARPFPENLVAAGDMVVFYPINRCYRHALADPACAENVRYRDALTSWFRHAPHLPVIIGEYYNVSKFEDLPLLFTETMSRDIPFYQEVGARGMTYMHLPMVNWAMRTATQVLYAELAWHGPVDRRQFLDTYLRAWYGPYAEAMVPVYERIEEAWRDVADWRAWSARSVLSELRLWDGKVPAIPLGTKTHFATAAGVIAAGERSLRLLTEANDLLAEVRRRERGTPTGPFAVADGVNPQELQRLAQGTAHLEMRLAEDRRLLLYGIDTMAVMTHLARCHEGLRTGTMAMANAAWADVECVADRLDSYYLPIGYSHPAPGIQSRDALTRTQVRELIRRIRPEVASGLKSFPPPRGMPPGGGGLPGRSS
jgi:hypothetical protein